MRAREHFRAHARRSIRLEAAVSDEFQRWSSAALVVNIALGGACVELERAPELRLDSGVALVVHAPSLWDPLALRARVAWIRRDGQAKTQLGLRFEHLEQGGLYALFQLLGAQSYE
jgi:hypothetical protein